jgi:hypothetical protein
MAHVHNLLELSDRHLPADLADSLSGIPGLAATYTTFGTLVRVPATLAATLQLPVAVVTLLRYARELDCDYLLLDPDVEVDDDLPTWDR